MSPAVDEPWKDTRLRPFGARYGLHGSEIGGEWRGIGFFSLSFQISNHGVERAPHLDRIGGGGVAFGRREARTVMDRVGEPDRDKHHEHGEGRHARWVFHNAGP